jgi:signal transduction histidine kinase
VFVHPDDRNAVRALSRDAVANGLTYDIEHRVLRPDGTVRWVHEQANILRDDQGRPRQMIGTVQDVTVRRQLEDQLRQAQKMEAIGRLAGGIAHDLNNALTAIAGYAELALGEVAADHPARPDVEEIRRAAERAGSVTRQLLAFSRKQLLEPRIFDLNNTITGIARLLSRLLGTDVHIETHLSDEPLTVLGDPGQVEQAVINLAVNARDAMPGGGTLSIAVAGSEGGVRITVADDGTGMADDVREHAFEPFFTTKEPGEGTGLGLSLSYGIVKQLGGSIDLKSKVGEGTEVTIALPRQA